jgi:hypothetical protein
MAQDATCGGLQPVGGFLTCPQISGNGTTAIRLVIFGEVSPAEPKKAAIAITEWAAKQADPEKALLAWARKNGRGAFAILEDAGDGRS